ncbi:conserved hypothetical protein [Methanocaldococcus sp. FS406-22]|uniref:hypothetical protein n=1 Tax=Methanocaldococcus sp. (strain FS406-22) TaxID=644281 RepID=UPI0001BF34F8|nr:hypothetical protein [Methanocaldococcus sp. FS406-22]ADC69816.1 conserved hypothetical protein [Methanocaldococcus sp. FS406-22]
MDVNVIIELLKAHWFEILLILGIVFILRSLKYIIIAILIVLGLSYFGILDIDNLKSVFENIISKIDILEILKAIGGR